MLKQYNSSKLAFFFIASGLLGIAGLLEANIGHMDAQHIMLVACGVAIAAGYMYVGARFKTLITAAPMQVYGVLGVGAVFLAFMAARAFLRGDSSSPAIPGGIFGLLFTVHLFRNAYRIAEEARGSVGGEPTVPDLVAARRDAWS